MPVEARAHAPSTVVGRCRVPEQSLAQLEAAYAYIDQSLAWPATAAALQHKQRCDKRASSACTEDLR